MSAVPDSQADDQTIKYSKRAFKRTFVYLDRPLSRAPSGKKMESLKANGRIADISFTKNHSDRDMGRLLLGSFPSLLGINLKSLTFIKSYEKGHSMAVINNGLLSGEELVRHYSSAHKKKIYFHSVGTQPCTSTTTSTQVTATSTQVDLTQTPPPTGTATRRLLTAIAQRSGVSHQDDASAEVLNDVESSDVDLDCIIINSASRSSAAIASNSPKDHVEVLTEELEVVGDVVEDLSAFGLPERRDKKGAYGRTEEVATVMQLLLVSITGLTLPPFLTHTFDELLWQAREDAAICILVLFADSLPLCDVAKAYINYLFKTLQQETTKRDGKFLFWLADSQSNEGSKVQAKYGLGDHTSLLIVIPSHIPQCVESFNEANFDQRKLAETLSSAIELSKILEKDRLNLDSKRKLIKEQDVEFEDIRKVEIRQDEEETKDDEQEIIEMGGQSGTIRKSSPEEHQQDAGKVEIRQEDEIKEKEQGKVEDEKETQVTFGPAQRMEDEEMDETLVDEVVGASNKKGKKKKKKNKKNKKKNKKRKAEEEPEEEASKNPKIDPQQ